MYLHFIFNHCLSWGLDTNKIWTLLTHLILIIQHNRYYLVMIEHFLKWLKLVPLLDCNNESDAYAFLDIVLTRFGALVEILINKGT
jgi:hypothetical protein